MNATPSTKLIAYFMIESSLSSILRPSFLVGFLIFTSSLIKIDMLITAMATLFNCIWANSNAAYLIYNPTFKLVPVTLGAIPLSAH
jgi:hypothetical protein